MKKRIGFIGIILLIVIGFDLLVGAVSGKLIKEVLSCIRGFFRHELL